MSVTRHNTLETVLKRARFMTGLTVFHGVRHACDKQVRDTLQSSCLTGVSLYK